MPQRDVTINRAAVTSMAYFGDAGTVASLYGHARRTMIRLGIGFADAPAVADDPALAVVDPVGTTPSVIDIMLWMDALNVNSDSDSDYDSDSDDDSVDQFEFMSRLYSTLKSQCPPTQKAVVDARGY